MLGRASYDLRLTDTKMPLLDGVELFWEIERCAPGLRDRPIFVTGDVLRPDKRVFLQRTGAPVVQKPFGLPEVRNLVRRMLARRAPQA